MPAELQPPELARLVDYAERPRRDDWSLRAALVRYAQPEPQRVSSILDLVRRIEWALRPHQKLLERDGPALWAALDGGDGPTTGPEAFVVELLRVTRELDELGDVVAEWAVDAGPERPDGVVDATITSVARHLDRLGVGREERVRPPRTA